LISGLQITEVELNPNDDCNDCSEWIELYSEEELNLNGVILKDAGNKTANLSGTIIGFKIYETKKIGITLNNANEILKLYLNEEEIFSTPIISDSKNNNLTWQYYLGNWIFKEQTKGRLYEEKDKELNNLSEKEETIEEPENAEKRYEQTDTSLSNEYSNEDSPIILETEGIKTKKNIIYQSKANNIKSITIYSICLICIFVLLISIIGDKNEKQNKNFDDI
jgi:hypothetical protein